MVFCTNCGRESKGGSFCAQCGAALEVVVEEKKIKSDLASGSTSESSNEIEAEQKEANHTLRNTLIGIVLLVILVGIVVAASSHSAAERERSQAVADRQAATELAARQAEQERARLEALSCKNYQAVFDSNPLGQAMGGDQAAAVEALIRYGSDVRQAVNDGYEVRVAGNNLADALTTVASELQLTGNVTPGTLANVDKFDTNLTRICSEFVK